MPDALACNGTVRRAIDITVPATANLERDARRRTVNKACR
jgi:hypothetical protein